MLESQPVPCCVSCTRGRDVGSQFLGPYASNLSCQYLRATAWEGNRSIYTLQQDKGR